MKVLNVFGIVVLCLIAALFFGVMPAAAQDGGGANGGAVIGASATLLYVLIGALAGGVGAVGAALVGVRFVLNSPILIAAMENLANSFPPEMKDLVHELGQLLKEIADDVPYAEKETDEAVG